MGLVHGLMDYEGEKGGIIALRNGRESEESRRYLVVRCSYCYEFYEQLSAHTMSLMSWLSIFGLMCGVSKTFTLEKLQLASDPTETVPPV